MKAIIIILGAAAFLVLVINAILGRRTRQTLARCRWCDRNDIPLPDMAVFSYKDSYKGYTGLCKKCFGDPHAEARYHRRQADRSKTENGPIAQTQQPHSPSHRPRTPNRSAQLD